VAPRFSSAGFRQTAVAYLRDSWFDPTSQTAHFPGHDVARIYAEGVLKALELALKGRRVVPLSVWWIVDAPDVRLLTLADVNAQGITIGGRVTLLIMTPRPRLDAPLSRNPILGDVADAWVTRQAGTGVTTERVRDVAAAGA
jgi:hypothetical protein